METSRDDFVIAIRSAFLKKGIKQKFSLLTLTLFSIFFLVLGNFNFKVINFNRTIIKEIIYYSSFIVTIPENVIKNSFNNVSEHFKYYEDYQIVKNDLKKLKDKDLSKQIITYENIELKRLIDDYFIEDSQVYAKVLIDKKSPFLKSIIINKGSKNDVRIGMIAQDEDYLIGRVVEVNFLTSRVLLISDINSKVPVTIQPSNIEAILSGLENEKGKLQYINGEQLLDKDDKELIVVTSGSGGIFKSGTPIGSIRSSNILNNNEIVVNFYSDFSQLKYVKIVSNKKEKSNLDRDIKKTFETNEEVLSKLNNQEEDIKIFQKKIIISEGVRNKLEEENSKLNIMLINTKKQLDEEKQKSTAIQIKNEDIKFLKFNLIYGPKCRKTFLRPKLFNVTSYKYRVCVLNKGIKKN